VDDQIYRNLSELVNLDDVGMLYLEFVVTEDKLGVTETVDLIPGGKCLSLLLFCNSYVHVIFVCGKVEYFEFDKIIGQY